MFLTYRIEPDSFRGQVGSLYKTREGAINDLERDSGCETSDWRNYFGILELEVVDEGL